MVSWGLLVSIYTAPVFTTHIAIVSVVIALLNMNRVTLGLSLLFFMSPILGVGFFLIGASLPAYLMCVALGSLVLGIPFFLQKNILRPLAVMATLVVLFVLWYLIGPRHGYSTNKLINVSVFGFVTLLGMKYIIERNDIQYARIAQLLGLISITYICIGIDIFQTSRPYGILDFAYIRDSYMQIVNAGLELPFTYHSIGVTAMIGIAYLACRQKMQMNIFWVAQSVLFLLILVVISQARQALLGTIILIVTRLLLQKSSLAIRVLMASGIIVFAIWGIASLSKDSTAYETSSHGSSVEEVVNRDYDDAYEMIITNLAVGTGFGGYSRTGEREYPHNILLELLCEMGIIGTFLVIIVTCIPILHQRKRWFSLTRSGTFFCILIIPYTMRAMASGDLITNVILLSMLIIFAQEKRSNFHQ